MVRASSKAIVTAALISAFPAIASAADAQKNSGIEEVVVTASRRAENLQKESRAVVAVGAADLIKNGISEPTAIQNLVPGLSMSRNGQQIQVYVRGVGDRTITAATDPAVALNIDGVYYPRSYQIGASIYDLERVEVLKGPQGTLYGRNASAGAVNFITAKPKLKNEGFLEVEAGSFSLMRATGAANFALSENAAIRISGQVTERDGYLTDGYNDESSHSLRGQLLWQPNNTDSLLISTSLSHIGGMGDAAVMGIIGSGVGNPFATATDQNFYGSKWAGPTDPDVLDYITRRNGAGTASMPKADGFQDIDVTTISADYTHDFSWGSLSILPSYISSTMANKAYVTIGVPTFDDAESKQSILEVRLSSLSGSRTKWVVGAFASKEEESDLLESWIAPPFALITPSERTDTSWAAYGEANFSITDNFRLIAGARYTWEEKELNGYTYPRFGPVTSFPIYPLLPSTDPSASDTSGKIEDDAVNFRVGVEYDLGEDIMLYANISTGFKAGGFYADQKPNEYKPETLTAYQAGFKSRFMDNRLQFNVEAFYWDYKDKQETFLGIANSASLGLVLKTENAGAATLYGFDASTIWRITDNDTIKADVSYLNSNYDEFVYSAFGGAPPGSLCIPTYAHTDPNLIDCSGLPLPRAPEWSGRVSYSHEFNLGTSGDLTFNIGTRFSSDYYVTNDYTPIEKAKSFTTSDATLTWDLPSNNASITAWVKNIEDEVIFTGGNQANQTVFNTMLGTISAPRTYGLRVRVSY